MVNSIAALDLSLSFSHSYEVVNSTSSESFQKGHCNSTIRRVFGLILSLQLVKNLTVLHIKTTGRGRRDHYDIDNKLSKTIIVVLN